MNDQPTPFQMVRSHMTPFAVQVCAVQSMLSVWPVKNPRTALAMPPCEAKRYENTQLTTTDEVTTGMYTAARQKAEPGRRSARTAAAKSPRKICRGTVKTIQRNELRAAVRTIGSWKILV